MIIQVAFIAASAMIGCLFPTTTLSVLICTPDDVTIQCDHSACAEHVPGSCFNTTDLKQSLVPDMRACYGDLDPELMNAAMLWNERPNRGIPSLVIAEGVGTIESKHMQIDIALLFDHWDIVDRKVREILAVSPNDPHALFAQAVYGSQGVLPSVDAADVPAILEKMEQVAPETGKAVDRTLADVSMVWKHEFLHPFVPGYTVEWQDHCESGMDTDNIRELFPTFACEFAPDEFSPSSLAIIAFGSTDPNQLEARIEAVRELAALYPQAVILATGGALETDRAEGDLILEALPEYQDRIVVDRLGRDTIGNCLAISEYVLQNDIGNIFSLTSTFHSPRALMACRGVFQRLEIDARTHMVAAGNNVQAPLGNWSDANQAWLETEYGGTGRFRAIEIPMTNRDFSRGQALFTMCDFEALEESTDDDDSSGCSSMLVFIAFICSFQQFILYM